MTTKYIDLTPTFRETTAICIAVIQNAAETKRPSAELVKAAADCKAELLRFADHLDRLKAKSDAEIADA